jgi:hypothetical protein
MYIKYIFKFVIDKKNKKVLVCILIIKLIILKLKQERCISLLLTCNESFIVVNDE